MAKTQILDYYIHLTDKALVETMQAQINAGGGPLVGALLFIPAQNRFAIFRAPLGAAAEFSAPLQEENVTFTSPGTRSPWFVPGANNFPRNVATFTRKSGGWFGIPLLFGQTTKFYWAGHVVYSPAGAVDGTGAAVTDNAPISKRRYVDGHEFLPAGDGQDNNVSFLHSTPDSSRHLGSYFGFAQREASTSGWDSEHETNAEGEALGTQFTHWDRFKIRARRYGTHESQFWAGNVNFIGRGFRLHMLAGGQIGLYVNSVGLLDADKQLLGTGGTLPLNEWKSVDVLMSARNDLTCFIEVYLNKQLIISGSHAIANDGDFIRGNFVGKLAAEVAAAQGEVDIDDWVGSECPKNMDTYNAVWNAATPYSIGDIVNFDPLTPGSFAPRTFQQVRGKAYRAKTANTNKQPDANPTDWARLNDGLDWLMGWRVVRVFAMGDGADRANWTGNFRHANQYPPAGQGIGAVDLITTAVDGAVLALTTDALDAAVRRPGVVGIGGINVSTNGSKSAAPLNDCQLGAKINGVNVMFPIEFALAGIGEYNAVCLNPAPAGSVTPFQLTSFELRYVMGTSSGGSLNAQYLGASIELIGTFGPEDVVPGTTPEPTFPAFHGGIHSRWAPYSPWALATSRAFAPVVVHLGTYAGNGLEQDLTFRCPVHFLWIRQVGAASQMTKWWPSMKNAHLDDDDAVFRGLVSDARPDPTFVPAGGEDDQASRYIVRIGGTHAGINQAGQTYQYIAVQDPGARFLLSGAFDLDDQFVGFPRTVSLAEPTWTPEAGFVWTEQEGAGTAGQSGFKGIGLGVNEAVEIPGTQRTSYMAFLAGALSVFGTVNGLVSGTFDNFAYLLFRRNDGNANTGAFVLVSWVGDGTASRTISWAPPTGKRPVWAYAAGSGGSTFVRDPSHTTTNSTNVATGSQGTTGITGGGIDSISVGTLLNANGITYTAIVFLGDATACNGGWGCNGEYIPDEPDTIKDPTWGEPVEVPAAGGGGGGPLSPDPDFDTSITPGTTACGPTGPLGSSTAQRRGWTGGQPCEFYTRRLLNMALQRIGQSKRIANAATDVTEEAFVAREFVLEDVNQVLHDFPWPFATRYANLVLVGGTAAVPVNNDWQYSYRAPACMIYARRMAKKGDFRKFDRHPIPFRVSTDDVGELIFCNEEATTDVPLVLEFTTRLTCPAWFGDPMFRNALTYRFAASFAGSLAKDAKKQEQMLAQYEVVLKSAQTDSSNEQQVQPHVDGDADWILDRDVGAEHDWLDDRN